ncbi:MAG: alpha/beta fold hydrolase [Chitinophagaceae bacterium]|nr:alpha/beta fold hydrolase [Chitinophagaceae bacterium]
MLQRMFLVLLLGTAFSSIHGQNSKFTGSWEGVLQAGIEIRIVFHIEENGKVKADSPDQSAFGLTCKDAIIKNQEIQIEITAVKASFSGRLINDSTIEGTFTQGADLPLTLKKTSKTDQPKTPEALKRPQQPLPPFPYQSEDLIYANADSSLRFGATITIPEGKGPFPAVVLISGSGPQNRNEELMGHQPFAVLADYLTRRGFIVLRADDRGVAKSTGVFDKATSRDFADDVNTHINYLLQRKEVNKKQIGLIGHSEGGMIAPMVAAERKDIAYIVLMAGPGVPCMDLLVEQNIAIYQSYGIPENAAAALRPVFKKIATAATQSPDMKTGFTQASAAAEEWAAQTDTATLRLLEMTQKKDRDKYIRELILTMSNPWFRYFLSFDPAPYLQQLKCAVLAINGGKDIQVLPKQNLPGIETALKKSKSKNYLVKELPGLNHLFQTCKECTIEEYRAIEETIAPIALETMGDWLQKIVKQ